MHTVHSRVAMCKQPCTVTVVQSKCPLSICVSGRDGLCRHRGVGRIKLNSHWVGCIGLRHWLMLWGKVMGEM